MAAHRRSVTATVAGQAIPDSDDPFVYVRIKPSVGIRIAQSCHRYLVCGLPFRRARWYRVRRVPPGGQGPNFLDILSRSRIDPLDPDSPLVFDLCDHDTAVRLHKAERLAARSPTLLESVGAAESHVSDGAGALLD